MRRILFAGVALLGICGAGGVAHAAVDLTMNPIVSQPLSIVIETGVAQGAGVAGRFGERVNSTRC